LLIAFLLQGKLEKYFAAQLAAPFQNMVFAQGPQDSGVPKPDLGVKSALSVRINFAGKKKIVFAKEPGEKLAIASITKLTTALVVLDDPQDYPLDLRVTVSPKAASQDNVPIFGNLKIGEVYTVKDLLSLMMYYSSNSAAYSLSEVVGVDKFVALMNARAKEIGLSQTEFYNPNGLDDGSIFNASSADDLVSLAQYIIKNQSGIFVFSTTPGPYANENGIFNVNLWSGQVLVGGKTGFTDAAGGCMLLVFRDDKNNYYFNVILGAATSQDRVNQMQKLVNYDNLN